MCLIWTCLILHCCKKIQFSYQNACAELTFLKSYKTQFLESADCGAFYTMVAKTFLERFGYSLVTEENPTIDDECIDATGENDLAL
jgi:hypothetical protein